MRARNKIKSFCLLSFVSFFTVFITSCSSISYTLQIVKGHFHVLYKSEPVDEVVTKSTTSEELREKLFLAKSAKVFAIETLKLPANSSYSRYTNLGRDAVVWNVVVANEFSLELENWCFPIAGCVSYKGFYSLKGAEEFAKKKKSEAGTEVAIVEVPAYSTLGWSNWVGGDPLLSTFIYGTETFVVGLIFHELAHQKIYVNDDSSFNEAFATAVEREGLEAWLKTKNKTSDIATYRDELKRRKDFNDLLAKASFDLRGVYSAEHNTQLMKFKKDKIIATLRNNLLSIPSFKNIEEDKKEKYLKWVFSINNAYLGMVGLYEDLTPGFRALFKKSNNSWNVFYQKVEQLSNLPKIKRQEILLRNASELQQN